MKNPLPPQAVFYIMPQNTATNLKARTGLRSPEHVHCSPANPDNYCQCQSIASRSLPKCCGVLWSIFLRVTFSLIFPDMSVTREKSGDLSSQHFSTGRSGCIGDPTRAYSTEAGNCRSKANNVDCRSRKNPVTAELCQVGGGDNIRYRRAWGGVGRQRLAPINEGP